MKRSLKNGLSILLLWFFIIVIFLPLYLAIVAASHDATSLMHAPLPLLPGSEFITNIKTIFSDGFSEVGGGFVLSFLLNSFIMALLIAAGKVFLALSSSYALVYFNFPFKKTAFGLIFITMMLPVEVRIVPTFQIIASFGWINTFSGLTLPLMASATATFLFRQFFKTIPNEMLYAAIIDGAGPFRFFVDILLPLSRAQMAALFIIMFVYGWNQYLWPLVISTDSSMTTIVMSIRYLTGIADNIPQWHIIMTIALVALLPPCLLIIVCQRFFEKGLND